MTILTLQSVQRSLAHYGLIPQTRLSRFCLTVGLILGAWTLVGVHGLVAAYRITLLLFIGALLGLGYRAFTQRFMWRLRNRLIVTYVFIGVIPLVLLATMGIVAGYLFAGQFSTFVVTTDVRNELRRLESANRTITHLAAGALSHSKALDPHQLAISNEAFPGRQVTAYYHGRADSLIGEMPGGEPAPPPPQVPEAVLIVDGGALYLRAVNRARLSNSPGDELIMVSSVPLDRPHLESIVSNMGVITLYSERPAGQNLSASQSSNRIKVGETEMDVKTLKTPTVSCGVMPPPASRLDVEFVPFATILNAVHWQSGKPNNLLLTVRTRPSLLYNRLFRTLGDMTGAILVVLVVIAVIFAFIEIVAFIIGVRLTRTMTSSVAKLYDATQHINEGDFSHRIQVSTRDQLASLESSFNSMTESLQKLIAEQQEKQRIESELSVAKEVQDLLFPRDAADLDGLELHGICRPARTVSGDYYDFLPVGPNAVGLAVGDISGKGISAALMMATVHAFVRAHTLAEQVPAMAAARGSVAPFILAENATCCPSPGTVLALLNQQLYRSTPAQKYATMFLGFYDQQTRCLCYSNAGHLPPIVICTDGSIHLLDTGGTVVGLFGDMAYPEGRVTLNPGDIVVAYSDGITEPENDFGDFGEERLAQIVQENRDLPLPRISDAILNAVTDWIGGEEQPDDMTIVLARAR
jgi:sigma-B regulation protein RsbU (phosphoserine phosphatase)